jgi:hypothetical protein
MSDDINISWDDPDELNLASQKGATLLATVSINGKTFYMTFIAFITFEAHVANHKNRNIPFCPTEAWINPVLVADISMEDIKLGVEYLAKYNLIPASWSLKP